MVVNGLDRDKLNFKGVVYKITFPNDKVYIGITNRKLIDRVYDHKEFISHSKQNLYKAFRKYGFENTVWEILEYEKYDEELYELEIKHIKEHNSSDGNFGYNMTEGGGGRNNSRHSKETLVKISGSNNHGAKLNETIVENIKLELVDGVKNSDVARKYNIGVSLVTAIKKCRIWKQVREDLNDKMIRREYRKNEKLVKDIKLKIIEGYENTEIANMLNTERQYIALIRKLKIYSNINPELNEQVVATLPKIRKDLDEEMVVEIKRLLCENKSHCEICEYLKLERSIYSDCIGNIKRLRTYKKYGSEYNEELRRLYGK